MPVPEKRKKPEPPSPTISVFDRIKSVVQEVVENVGKAAEDREEKDDGLGID